MSIALQVMVGVVLVLLVLLVLAAPAILDATERVSKVVETYEED